MIRTCTDYIGRMAIVPNPWTLCPLISVVANAIKLVEWASCIVHLSVGLLRAVSQIYFNIYHIAIKDNTKM